MQTEQKSSGLFVQPAGRFATQGRATQKTRPISFRRAKGAPAFGAMNL